jgi:hypothetical protein
MIKSVKARTPVLALILFVFAVGYTVAATNKVVIVPLGSEVNNLVLPERDLRSFVVSVGSVSQILLFTVPNNKTFVMTDILSSGTSAVSILKDSATIAVIKGGEIANFTSGIKFNSGSKLSTLTSSSVVTVSGYLY